MIVIVTTISVYLGGDKGAPFLTDPADARTMRRAPSNAVVEKARRRILEPGRTTPAASGARP